MIRLVCLADKWKDHDSKEISEAGPKKGEIVTCINEKCYHGTIYLCLKGYEDWYNKKDFRPIEPIGEVIADYIEQTAFKEYQFEETVKELQKWAGG